MKNRRNVFALCLAWGFGAVLFGACASSEEGVFDNTTPNDGGEASAGSAGFGTGGSAGSWGGGSGTAGTGAKPGTGGTGSGGTAGTGSGGTAGTGTGGASGTAGASGSSGSGGSTGSCNPAFCPNTGSGTPCCVSPNGPCGTDHGSGCQNTPGGDF